MENLLNRQVQLSEESDSWFLKEFDANGIQIGGDQVPTKHTIDLYAYDLNFSSDLYAASNTKTHTNESITAKLNLGWVDTNEMASGSWWPELSMFGTDRYIKHFSLSIKKLDDNLTPDHCEMIGRLAWEDDMMGYEDGDYFCGTTEFDDWIAIILYLRPKQFDKLAESIKSQLIYSINLSLIASGTYANRATYDSERPSLLKILLDTYSQKVVIPEDSLIKPEVLGNVDWFKLSIQECGRAFPERAFRPIDNIEESPSVNGEAKDLNDELNKDILNINTLLLDQLVHTESALKSLSELIDNQFKKNDLNQEEIVDKNEPNVNALLLAQLIRNEKILKKLRTPLWLILIILLCLAIKILL